MTSRVIGKTVATFYTCAESLTSHSLDGLKPYYCEAIEGKYKSRREKTTKHFSLLRRYSGSAWKHNNNNTSNLRVYVTLRGVRVAIIAEEK